MIFRNENVDLVKLVIRLVNKILLIFIMFCTVLFSQMAELRVLGVYVEGNKRLSQEDVIRNARIYDGMTIKSDEIQKGIKRLWKLNRFSNIQIFVTEETNDGIYLLIKVEEYPTLGNYSFSGNKKSKRTLNEEITLASGQILSDKSVFDAMESLRNFYISKHYHNVEINTIFKNTDETNIVDLEFKISEGKKLKIREIEINGNHTHSDFKLKRQLKETKPWNLLMPWRGKWMKKSLHQIKLNWYDFIKIRVIKIFILKVMS